MPRSLALRRRNRAFLVALVLTFLICFATACDVRPSDALGEAYVAPAQLNVRRELSGKTGNSAILKHGERVSIIDIRRRFVKIRTLKGLEGWVDSSQLLSTDQMRDLKKETARALTLPSQGSATVYEALNIHIEPNRQSPALAKIPEGGMVAVLAHKLAPRTNTPPPAPQLLKERPQAPARRKREKSTHSLRLPPPPRPPAAPENWQELSTERIGKQESIAELKARKEAEAAAKKAQEAKKPVVLEEWTLVRTSDKQAGWVLSRNLVMAIPDEVAQYAEGKRITSYFDLGSVNDEEKGQKHNWIWTTSSRQQPYDFDAWRVFLWNRRRHRYETSYRQRDLEGYFPVTVDPADANTFGRTFHLITKDEDGKFRRRSYVFDGTRVHLINTENYQPAGAPSGKDSPGQNSDKLKTQAPAGNWLSRQWHRLTGKRTEQQ